MRLFHFVFGLIALTYSASALAIGGYAGFIAGEFGGSPYSGFSGGFQNHYATNSRLSPVVTHRLPQFNTRNYYQPQNVGGYAGFIQSQQQNSGFVGGFAGLVQVAPQKFPGVTTNRTSSPSGFSQFFGKGLQANAFQASCRDVPPPVNATCNGGQFVPLRSVKGCIVNWQCRGGNFCPATQRPNTRCDGTLEPQTNGRGCVTHFFCRRNRTQFRSIDQVRNCPTSYYPACGLLGNRPQTFLNRCRLDRAGARFVNNGECRRVRSNPYPPQQPVVLNVQQGEHGGRPDGFGFD